LICWCCQCTIRCSSGDQGNWLGSPWSILRPKQRMRWRMA
jgi:hypothetical protein